jgi:hypothetical protein
LLGRFEVWAGGGKYLHADREYMRRKLHDISGQTSRQAFIYRQLYEFNPCRLLQGGKAFVDAPGTGDQTPLHRGHLKVRAWSLVEHEHTRTRTHIRLQTR